jgi:hypothetical protein
LIIIKALYGLKGTGAHNHDYWADEMHEQGWFPSKCDPDVDHYEYLAVWVDDLLNVGKVPLVAYAVCLAFGKTKVKMTMIRMSHFHLFPAVHAGIDA